MSKTREFLKTGKRNRGLGFFVPKERRIQRVETVKTFETKPQMDSNALLGIWAFTV